MALYETPSRIWRRIEDEREPSSLPSLPGFEHSVVPDTESDHTTTDDDNELLPVHSTPAAASSHNATATIRLQSSTSSTVRFATSIASRSASVKSSGSRSFGHVVPRSFDVSAITSLPHDSEENTDPEDPPEKSTNSVPEAYLPPPESDEAEDMSLVDALESVSRASSPLSPEPLPQEPTSKKNGLPYDYSISLRSEPQVSLLLACYLSIDARYRASLPPLTSIVMSLCVDPLLVLEHHRSRAPHPPLRRLLHPIPPPGATVPSRCPEIQSRPSQASMSHFPDRQAPLRPSPHYKAQSSSHPSRTTHERATKTGMRLLTHMRNSSRVNPSGFPIQMMTAPQIGNPHFRPRLLTPAIQWTLQSKPLVPLSLHRPHFPLLRHQRHLHPLPPSHRVHALGSISHPLRRNYTPEKTSRWIQNQLHPTHAEDHSSSPSLIPPPVPA